MPNKVMEHTSTDEKTCDNQTTQEDTSNNQVADIGIARFVAAPGLVARVVAPIHDDLCPPFNANCDPETGRNPALDPLTRPAPAEESAGAGHPLPQGGEGLDFGSLGVRHCRSRRPMHRNTSAQMWELQSRATPVPQGGEGLGSLGVRHCRSRRPMHRNTSAQMWELQSRATPVLRMVT